jgi:hypothetical protein
MGEHKQRLRTLKKRTIGVSTCITDDVLTLRFTLSLLVSLGNEKVADFYGSFDDTRCHKEGFFKAVVVSYIRGTSPTCLSDR